MHVSVEHLFEPLQSFFSHPSLPRPFISPFTFYFLPRRLFFLPGFLASRSGHSSAPHSDYRVSPLLRERIPTPNLVSPPRRPRIPTPQRAIKKTVLDLSFPMGRFIFIPYDSFDWTWLVVTGTAIYFQYYESTFRPAQSRESLVFFTCIALACLFAIHFGKIRTFLLRFQPNS